jgi:hypothetical protein
VCMDPSGVSIWPDTVHVCRVATMIVVGSFRPS